MRKYTQITIVITMLFFLVWLRSAKLGADDSFTVGIKENNQLEDVVKTTSPTPTLTPNTNGNGGIPTQQADNTTLTPTSAPQIQQGKYKDGTYTGNVADAFYGNVQVQVLISGGEIADVVFLQYPNHNSTSININSQAMPLLKQEAIAAQSADVSGVSGASATSPAFKQSLASALSQAL
jgi:uncharacterized protein with FMN-binding domain